LAIGQRQLAASPLFLAVKFRDHFGVQSKIETKFFFDRFPIRSGFSVVALFGAGEFAAV
jgi:hypothetical protein